MIQPNKHNAWKIDHMGADILQVPAPIRDPLRLGGTKGPMEPQEPGITKQSAVHRRPRPHLIARASPGSKVLAFAPSSILLERYALLIFFFWTDSSTTGPRTTNMHVPSSRHAMESFPCTLVSTKMPYLFVHVQLTTIFIRPFAPAARMVSLMMQPEPEALGKHRRQRRTKQRGNEPSASIKKKTSHRKHLAAENLLGPHILCRERHIEKYLRPLWR